MKQMIKKNLKKKNIEYRKIVELINNNHLPIEIEHLKLFRRENVQNKLKKKTKLS